MVEEEEEHVVSAEDEEQEAEGPYGGIQETTERRHILELVSMVYVLLSQHFLLFLLLHTS